MTTIKAVGFWLASCTWGIVMTLIGAVGAFVFAIKGNRARRVGYSLYFVSGNGWGAVALGPFIFMSEGSARSEATRIHEAGHGVQNCLWGVLFPFVIGLPSLISCAVNPAKHSSRWFEMQATKLGERFCAF